MTDVPQLAVPARRNTAQRVPGGILVRPSGPLTIGDVADLIGLPGKTNGARAQLLRRLEARGVLPPARRSLISGRRYWYPQEVADLRQRLAEVA